MMLRGGLRIAGCALRRQYGLRCFASLVNCPERPRLPRGSSTLRAPYQARRWLLEARHSPESIIGEENHAETAHVEASEMAHDDIVDEPDTSNIPWYLQVDNAPQKSKPLSERQKIPDLPEFPPPILEPLLQKISVDLGLDDLTFLDLRKLDPPPALGANLLMVLGTARGEKHLHVSADRLCRWLRTTYKLKPDADGLLGRNELKLKAKRKAKRAKLMERATDEPMDDGILAKWVCVDLGIVPAAEDFVDQTVRNENFVGFGARTNGVRIVVQILTDEKRSEMDLERLWSGILKRNGMPEMDDPDSSGTPADVDGGIQDVPSSHQTLFSSTAIQKRGFHTYIPRARHESIATRSHTVNMLDVQDSIQIFGEPEDVNAAQSRDSATNNVEKEDEQKSRLLQDLKTQIESLPREEAIIALGINSHDHDSTPFLRTFYGALTSFPTQIETQAKVWLHCWAQLQGHPGYTAESIHELFREIEYSGVNIGASSWVNLIRGMLPQRDELTYHGPSISALESVTRVLAIMQDQGISILNEHILLQLQKATSRSLRIEIPPHDGYSDPVDTFELPSQPLSPIQKRLHLLMMNLNELPSESTRLGLLILYSSQHNWIEFWETWRLAARHRISRSAELYSNMFAIIATTNHQRGCISVLRTWIPEMLREQPAVQLEGDVAFAVTHCLKVIDPYIEESLTADPELNGEWLSLWRRCHSNE